MTDEQIKELGLRILTGEKIPVTQGLLSLILMERRRAEAAEAQLSQVREELSQERERSMRYEIEIYRLRDEIQGGK